MDAVLKIGAVQIFCRRAFKELNRVNRGPKSIFGSRQLRTQSVEPHSDRAKRRIRPSSVTNGGCDKPIARSDLMVGTGTHGEQLGLV